MLSLHHTADVALFRLLGLQSDANFFVSTSEHGRALLTSSLLTDVEYQRLLCRASSVALQQLRSCGELDIPKATTEVVDVVNVLRGGLNFGLQEAVVEGLHLPTRSSFLARERTVVDGGVNLSDGMYDRIAFDDPSMVVIADICATGTTMKSVVQELVAKASPSDEMHFVLIVIGTTSSASALDEMICSVMSAHENVRFSVVFLEGAFGLYSGTETLEFHLLATDFVRRGGVFAPAYLEYCFLKPICLLERCAIYDGGTRGFDGLQHLTGLLSYWDKLAALFRGDAGRPLVHVRVKVDSGLSETFNRWLESHPEWGTLTESVVQGVYQKRVDAEMILTSADAIRRLSDDYCQVVRQARWRRYAGN